MPVPSATGMNSPGGMSPWGRVLPAQQRLDTLDRSPSSVTWAGSAGTARSPLSRARRRSPSTVSRQGGACVLGRRTRRAPPFSSLAAYIAMSALRSSVLGVLAVRGDARCRCWPRRRGRRRRRRRAVQAPGAAARRRPAPRRRRPRTAAGRRTRRHPGAPRCRRRAAPTQPRRRPGRAACRRRSGPGVSLISLKRSRSMSSRATSPSDRAAAASPWSRRSRSSTQLGRPVSASWVAWCRSRSAEAFGAFALTAQARDAEAMSRKTTT